MAGLDFDAVLKTLRSKDAFSDDQMTLMEAEGDAVITWAADEYATALDMSRLEALAARQLVHDAFGAMGVTEQRAVELPKAPPYLKDTGHPATFEKKLGEAGTKIVKDKAVSGDYDPTDQTQFTKIGDQYFRWDGQRSERHPAGQSHEITFVDHRNVHGMQVPYPEQVAEALRKGQGWFHKGYNCWIRPNGKRSAEVSQERLVAMRNATGPRARTAA